MIGWIVDLALGGQIVCPDPAGVWPPAGSTVPTNAVFGLELDDFDGFDGSSDARLEVGGRSVGLEAEVRYRTTGRRWLVLRPDEELPPDSVVTWVEDGASREPPVTWRTASGEDTTPPRIGPDPAVAARRRSDVTLENTHTSLDGLRYHEDRLWWLAEVDEAGPWVALVDAGGGGYPVSPVAGLVPIGVDECGGPFPAPSETRAYTLRIVDAAGNVSDPVEVHPTVPAPPPPVPVEAPANLCCWTAPASGAALAWAGEAEVGGYPRAVEAPDGALWVLGDRGTWRGEALVSGPVGTVWFDAEGGRFTSGECSLSWTPPGGEVPAWTREVPCGGASRTLDGDGVLWTGTAGSWTGIERTGADRGLTADALRDGVLGPDGALYGKSGRELARVDPRTGAVSRWPGDAAAPLAVAGDGVYAVLADGIVRIGPDGPVAVSPETPRWLAGTRQGLWWADEAAVGAVGGATFGAAALGCAGPIRQLVGGSARVWVRCGPSFVAVGPDGPTGDVWSRPGRFGWSRLEQVDADGAVWFGTATGVARVRDGQVTPLPVGDAVTGIVRTGTTGWALRSNGGLVRFTERPDVLEVAGWIPSTWGQGRALRADVDGLWVVGTTGLVRLGADGSQKFRVPGSWSDLVVGPDGPWALFDGAIERIDPETGARSEPVALPEGLRVRSLVRDVGGRLWASGPDVAVWNGAGWEVLEVAGTVQAVLPGPDGSVRIVGDRTWRVGPDGTDAVVDERPELSVMRGVPLRSAGGRIEEALYRVWTGPVGGAVLADEGRVWTFGAGAAAAREDATGAWRSWSGVGQQGRDYVDDLAPTSAAVRGETAWFVRPRDWLLQLDPGGVRTWLPTPGTPIAVARDQDTLWLLADAAGARAVFGRPLSGGDWARVAEVPPDVRSLVSGPSGLWAVALETRRDEPGRASATLVVPSRSGRVREVGAPIASTGVPELLETRDGSLWFAGVGVGRVGPDGAVRRFDRVGSFPLGERAHVAADPVGDRAVWIAGGGAVARLDGGLVVPVAVGLPEITGLGVRGGVAWVSTVDGLVRIGADRTLDRLDPAVFARPGAPLSAGPTVAAPDRVAWWQEGAWVGPGHEGTVLAVDGGWALDAMGTLHRADGRQWRAPIPRPAALVARPDGGCVGGAGVACWTGEAVDQAALLPAMPAGEVTALALQDGDLWAGTDAGAACRLTEGGWACRAVGGAVRTLVPSGAGLLVGHAGGVSVLGAGAVTAIRGPDVRALAVRGDTVFAGTSRGLFRVSPAGWAALEDAAGSSPPALGIVADERGLLVIRGGRVERSDRPFRPFPPGHRCASGPGSSSWAIVGLLAAWRRRSRRPNPA